MPLYEYRCNDCNDTFEYMQSMSARPKRKCEACGGKLEKLVSRSGFVLKGTGWYVTDFRDGPKKKDPDKSDGAASETKTGEKSEKADKGKTAKGGATPAGASEGQASKGGDGPKKTKAIA